jgi:serine-type D-Ala-D-Ala carboxypeptidase (penicillin-binding protein 5/6)
MRRYLRSFLLACCLVLTLFHAQANANIAQDLAPNATSAILMDASTGTVLFEKNSHQPLPPASITKVMTMILVMEALDEGKINLSDKVSVSEYASSMGGSQIFLQPGEQMTVQDLLKGIAIASANDASVALAELLGGTEEQFVQMMNDKAKQLGLQHTRFVNPNGLPAENHYSSVYDIAVMSRELLKHPDVTKFTGVYQDYLRQDSKSPFWLVNTNKLIRFYQGADGLKTGFTVEAKFCLTATAKRGDLRVIAAVMGEPDPKTRNSEISKMLDYAFNQYHSYLVYKKGELIAEKQVEKGNPAKIQIRANQPITLLLKKGENPRALKRKIVWKELKAPIQKGEVLGKIEFEKEGKFFSQLELVSNHKVEKANLWTITKQVLHETLFFPENKSEFPEK